MKYRDTIVCVVPLSENPVTQTANDGRDPSHQEFQQCTMNFLVTCFFSRVPLTPRFLLAYKVPTLKLC